MSARYMLKGRTESTESTESTEMVVPLANTNGTNLTNSFGLVSQNAEYLKLHKGE